MLKKSEPEPEPEPKPLTKGEEKRKQIIEAIQLYFDQYNKPPNSQDIQELTGLQSYNTITRHLKALHQEGSIHWDQSSASISIRDTHRRTK
jgi:SOS-response transcriptional repressor LexA